jgi:L-ribulokinase
VAAGAHPDVRAAAEAMGSVHAAAYTPDPGRVRAYDALYAEYRRLHDHFGRGEVSATRAATTCCTAAPDPRAAVAR